MFVVTRDAESGNIFLNVIHERRLQADRWQRVTPALHVPPCAERDRSTHRGLVVVNAEGDDSLIS
jgi:hypothetical protein